MHSNVNTFFDLRSYNRIDAFSKISYLITTYWVESINATMTGDVHRTYGYRNKTTGIVSGMSGQLERKEADIGGLIYKQIVLQNN